LRVVQIDFELLKLPSLQVFVKISVGRLVSCLQISSRFCLNLSK